MPELPEVEAIRRHLAETLTGASVCRVAVHRRDVVRDLRGRRRGRIDPALLGVGERIESLDRRGKQLILRFGGGSAVVIRLGMSGRVDLQPHGARGVPPHRHVVWMLRTIEGDRIRMEFIDARRFGGVHIAASGTDLQDRLLDRLGPEAHQIEGEELLGRLARTTRSVKVAILDQAVLAGVGNIYADEALFQSRIHPTQPACTLTKPQVDRLAKSLRSILLVAIEHGGSTIQTHTLPDGRTGSFTQNHKVYGRVGSACTRCGSILEQIILAARSTTWCPSCQPVGNATSSAR